MANVSANFRFASIIFHLFPGRKELFELFIKLRNRLLFHNIIHGIFMDQCSDQVTPILSRAFPSSSYSTLSIIKQKRKVKQRVVVSKSVIVQKIISIVIQLNNSSKAHYDKVKTLKLKNLWRMKYRGKVFCFSYCIKIIILY